ncbi:MAG: hypothetical protein HYY29_05150, partial [Chloroflexi bacterium]|nr:hypothetical protein [Chloroflexota bacterium]
DGQTPAYFARLYPKLTGSKDDSYTVTLDAATLSLSSGVVTPRDSVVSLTFRRGDALPDGQVTIADALVIAQHLAGLRGLGEGANENSLEYVAAVNAAGVRHDYVAGSLPGDTITITDALFIGQMLAQLRDGWYEQR